MQVRRSGTLLSLLPKTSNRDVQTDDIISRPGSALASSSTSDKQLSPGGDTTRDMSYHPKRKTFLRVLHSPLTEACGR